MEQYWTNERNEIPKGELEFWAMRRGLVLGGKAAVPAGPREVECTALRSLAVSARLGVALGVAMEGGVLAVGLLAGSHASAAQAAVDLAHGVAWSFLICAGLGLGTAIGRTQGYLAGALLCMAAAALATDVAADAGNAMAALLGQPGQVAMLSKGALGVIHAVEFGVLGWLLASLAARQEALRRFVTGGATIGLLFGGVIVLLTRQAVESRGMVLGGEQMAAISIGEMLFPLGSALVTYIALQVGRRATPDMPTAAK